MEKQCQLHFRKEWEDLLDKYNKMRESVFKAESKYLLSEAQKYYLESEASASQRYYNLARDYKIDWVEDYEYDPEKHEIHPDVISQLNSVLDVPFSFYGGFIQLGQYKKDTIVESLTVKKLLHIISDMKREREEMITEREMIQNVARMNFDLAQTDADRIKAQAEEIKQLKSMIDINQRLLGKEKREIYNSVKKEVKDLQKELKEYKMYAE